MCDLFRICPIYFINLQSKCPHSLMDRIKDSGSFGRGSNPLGGTGQRHSTSERLFLLLQFMEMVYPKDLLRYFELTGLSLEEVAQVLRNSLTASSVVSV